MHYLHLGYFLFISHASCFFIVLQFRWLWEFRNNSGNDNLLNNYVIDPWWGKKWAIRQSKLRTINYCVPSSSWDIWFGSSTVDAENLHILCNYSPGWFWFRWSETPLFGKQRGRLPACTHVMNIVEYRWIHIHLNPLRCESFEADVWEPVS